MTPEDLLDTVDLGGPGEPAPDGLGHGRPLPHTDLRLIGRGGSSEVFEAFDPVLRRRVAVKVLIRPVEQARFLREARIMAQLKHPHIVPVHDYGVAPDGSAWLCMALVEGTTLDVWVRGLGERRFTRGGLLDLLDQVDRVCDALAYAHSRGVLHLDLKPANVMVSDFGRVMLMDWGIARQIGVPGGTGGPLYGTPSFVAPELLNNPDTVDVRADVFGLAGLLYACLTDRPPHQGPNRAATLTRASHGTVPTPEDLDPSVPDALVTLVMQGLERDPAGRPPSVAAFQGRLRQLRRSSWSLPTRRVPAGAFVIRSGEHGEQAFVVAEGAFEVRDPEGAVVRRMGPGEVFGELAVLTRRRRSMDVVALQDGVVHVVSREALASGLGLGTWAGAFARALAKRFAELESRMPTLDDG